MHKSSPRNVPASEIFIAKLPELRVVEPTVLPTVGRRDSTKKLGLGALRPTAQGYLAHKKKSTPLGPL